MTTLKSSLSKDVIEVGQQFYIRASSSLADDRTRVLLNGDTFAVFDRGGDIQPVGFGQQGIFHKETPASLAAGNAAVRGATAAARVRPSAKTTCCSLST